MLQKLLWRAIAFAALILAVPCAVSAMDEAAFESALKKRPDDVDTRLQYALFLAREGAHDAAVHHVHAPKQ